MLLQQNVRSLFVVAAVFRLSETGSPGTFGSMTWWKESSYWKWWQYDDAEAVPSSVAAGSWEGGTSSSATETWDWTDPGPEPGVGNEEAPRRGRGGRNGSAHPWQGGDLGIPMAVQTLDWKIILVREASASAPVWTDAPSQRGNSTQRQLG